MQSHNSNMVMFNFLLLSGCRRFFGDVRKPSLKCLVACLRSWTGMWTSSFQEKVLRTNLRKVSWEPLQYLLRLLFCVSTVGHYLNQEGEHPTEFRNGKAGFQTLLGIRAGGDCSFPRGILTLSSASLSLAPWVWCVCLWDPSLGVHFSCQQMDGSPQLWPTTALPSRKQTAAELSPWELTSWRSSSRAVPLPVSFYRGVMSVAARILWQHSEITVLGGFKKSSWWKNCLWEKKFSLLTTVNSCWPESELGYVK